MLLNIYLPFCSADWLFLMLLRFSRALLDFFDLTMFDSLDTDCLAEYFVLTLDSFLYQSMYLEMDTINIQFY